MASPELLTKLAAFVPTPVVQAIYRQPRPITQPLARRFPAAVLFTDISGFTTLSELLSHAGPTGAEELTQLINHYFSYMIQIVQAHHGQVVKFSGDAMTVIFPAEHIPLQLAVRRAGQCALAMQARLRQSAQIKTSAGQASLSMKVGLGAGHILECTIGGALDRWEYLVAGAPLVQVAAAEHHARSGQIVLSPEAWQEAQDFFIATPNPDRRGFYNLYKAINPLPELMPVALDWRNLTKKQRRLAATALQAYLPGAIKARLNEQADWLAELRRMTILFIGIGGFDYEAPQAGEQLQKFLRQVQELIYRFEGSLGKIAVDDKGTVLLILFGAPPFSHEDDTSRAVACALALQQIAQEQNLHMAIGITEGPIFAGPVGAPSRREYTVIGDEVNLAARLMQYGRAGSIIISERVKERAGPQFILESLGPITVRGKTKTLAAYQVKGEQGVQGKMVSRYLLHEDPLIGRKAELEQIRRMAARARAGKLQLLFIEGELGLGKSRLAAEMVREWVAEGDIAYGGKSVSYGRQIPYQSWREILNSLLGIAPHHSASQQLSRLAASLANLTAPLDQPAYWPDRLPLLADVLGLEAPENSFSQGITSKLRRNNTFALVETLLRHHLEKHPLLILLEDIHWADELSLALATHLVKKLADTPLLLALVHRPITETAALTELKDLPLDSYTIQLEPLTPQESLDLVKLILTDRPLTPAAEELLLHRGQGNPFFLQEIARAILDLAGNSDNQRFDLPENLDLPDTVQDVILSRIDRLSEAEKLTLKVASVIGATFQRSLLSEIHPVREAQIHLSSQLDKLEHEKLVKLETPAPKWEYVFRNVIAQEVVYEGLLLAQRRQLHASVGAALELLAPDEVEQLAYHYGRSDNTAKATHFLKLSAQKARREYANQVAINYYSEILNLLADSERGSGMLTANYWDILLERARLYNLSGRRDQELEDLGALGIIAEALHDNYRRALAAKQWVHLYETSGDYDSGLEVVERVVHLAQQAGEETLIGEAYSQWGKLLYLRGDYRTAHNYLQQALLIAQRFQNKSAQADCLNNLGLVAHYQADYDVALYLFQEAIDTWQASGDQLGLGNSLCNLGQVYYDLGQYMAAQERYDQALALHRTIGDRAGEALAQHNLGRIQRSLGHYEAAEQFFSQALAFFQAIGDRHHEAHGFSQLGFLYTRLADYERAIALLEKALEIFKELKDPWGLSKTLTYYSWTLHDKGQLRQAKETITEALRIERESQQEIAMMENIALLGQIALSFNDLSLAYTCARRALNFIEFQGIQGIEHPAMVYLICYRVFQANQKYEQAHQVLVQAQTYIATQAGQITDPTLRQSYLSNIPENRQLHVIWV
jgi:class 3 adenylate cyclase/predicted ATPase